MTTAYLLRPGTVVERTDRYVRVRVSSPCQSCEAKCGFGRTAGQGIIKITNCENPPPPGSAVQIGVSRDGLTRVSASLFLPTIAVFILVMVLAGNSVADFIVAGVGSVALPLALGFGVLVSRRGVRMLEVDIE